MHKFHHTFILFYAKRCGSVKLIYILFRLSYDTRIWFDLVPSCLFHAESYIVSDQVR